MNKLFFTKDLNLKNNYEFLLDYFKKHFKENTRVAIKMHMGEQGNKTHLKAEDVQPIIDILKELKTEPFIVETPTRYPGGRYTSEDYFNTARENGFKEEVLECPIIITDEGEDIRTPHMKFEVCKEMYDVEYMVVLSHVKGHGCSGFGAAIKNLSMGGATRKSKGDMHALGEPELCGECKLCKTCEKLCPFNAIKVDDKWKLDTGLCFGCDICVDNCPHHVLKPKIASFDELLAEGAWASVHNKKKIIYINMLKRITQFCDCHADSGECVTDDIGVLIGENAVAIDQASLDLVNEQKKNIFIKKTTKTLHYKLTLQKS